MKQPLIYQDQDSLNSVRVVLANAEKSALISIQQPNLKDEAVEEKQTTALVAGVSSGIATLVIMIAAAASSVANAGRAIWSAPGITMSLSSIGKLLGGVVINNMFTGILLLVLAPVLVGTAVGMPLRQRALKKQQEAFLAEKRALQTRAVQCRDTIRTKLTDVDPKWRAELENHLALVEHIISNLAMDMGREIIKK